MKLFKQYIKRKISYALALLMLAVGLVITFFAFETALDLGTDFGVATSLLLAIILFLLSQARVRSADIAAATTKELTKQKEKLTHIIDGTNTGTWEWNVNTGETRFNAKWAEFIGYTLDEIQPTTIETWIKYAHPDDAKVSAALLASHFSGEQEYYECEVRMRHKDGRWIWLLDRGKVTSWMPDGKPLLMFGTHQDITARKNIEIELKRNKAQLNALIQSIPDIVWMKDVNGTYLSGNHMLERFMDMDLSKLLGKTDYDIVNKELADFFRAHDVKAMQSKELITYEEYLTFLDTGYYGLFETTKTSVYDENRDLIGVIGISHDMSRRKKIENALNVAATAFEAHEGIFVTDADNKILRVNSAFTLITGYSSEEVIGKTPRILSSGRQNKAFYKTMWDWILNKGTWEGEIWNRRKNGEIYPERLSITVVKDASGVTTNYVAMLSDITMSKAASEEIKNLAFYDPLTHLPNRRLLVDRLKQAIASSARSNQHGALLLIDLDHFKSLNDSLGHDVGDLLLEQVANRLTYCVREGDTVARLGGDEFVILLEDLGESSEDAAAKTEVIGEKIIRTLNQPYQLGSHEHHSTPSIGATLINDHETGIDALLKQADIAMYQSKHQGRNTLRFFDPKMQELILARVNMEHDLHIAIEQQQFHLYYQIQVDSTGRPLGAETLIRWIHPEHNMISPIKFIPLAEETGLILPIGQWVIETACAQLALWQQNADRRNLELSVNVSAKQFHQADFVAQVQQVVHRHGIDASKLKLELTESMLVDNVDDIIEKMKILSAIGIRFSLDDFGTGYSSIQYLKKLPLSQLKIDQSFVRDIVEDNSDYAIVSTIILMAHSLGLNVIAEGVETTEQQQCLLGRDCTNFQGYLFGKPMPIDEFEALLQ